MCLLQIFAGPDNWDWVHAQLGIVDGSAITVQRIPFVVERADRFVLRDEPLLQCAYLAILG